MTRLPFKDIYNFYFHPQYRVLIFPHACANNIYPIFR